MSSFLYCLILKENGLNFNTTGRKIYFLKICGHYRGLKVSPKKYKIGVPI